MMHPTLRLMVVLIAVLSGALVACAGDRSFGLAGRYEFQQRTVSGANSSRFRRTLTLRPDGSWTWLDVTELNGRPASRSADSGSFSFHKERLVLRSAHGLTMFRVAGDTLWSDTSEIDRMGEMIDGLPRKSEQYFVVRRRGRPATRLGSP